MNLGLRDKQLRYLELLLSEGRLSSAAVRDLAAQLRAIIRRLEQLSRAGSELARDARLVAGLLERVADSPDRWPVAVPAAIRAYAAVRDELRRLQHNRKMTSHAWRVGLERREAARNQSLNPSASRL